MTFVAKCDTCGITQDIPYDNNSWPSNPINPETGEKWFSRYDIAAGKTRHACCRAHIPKDELVSPI